MTGQPMEGCNTPSTASAPGISGTKCMGSGTGSPPPRANGRRRAPSVSLAPRSRSRSRWTGAITRSWWSAPARTRHRRLDQLLCGLVCARLAPTRRPTCSRHRWTRPPMPSAIPATFRIVPRYAGTCGRQRADRPGGQPASGRGGRGRKPDPRARHRRMGCRRLCHRNRHPPDGRGRRPQPVARAGPGLCARRSRRPAAERGPSRPRCKPPRARR